ncbi:hypothetical protein Tco_0023953 [Tanacetum coccineum]
MSGEEPAAQIAPVESPPIVSTVKLPILKKGEYTLWSMRMEQYLIVSLWQGILNGDGPIQVTTNEKGLETKVTLKTAQALLARQRERKAKSILLLAIPDEYQLRFHAIKDAKTLWAAIKSRFGSNVKSKKMQKNVLKKQFENFSVSDTECLDKAYDSIDYEEQRWPFSGSSLNSQNVAFLSVEDTRSSNESNSPQLDDEDLEQIDHDDLEEMDLKWQVLIKLRLNALTIIEGAILQGNVEHQEIKGTGMEMQGIGAGKTPKDGLGYDWSYIAQDEPTEFALIAYTSNSSGSDTERQTLSKANLEIVAYQLGLESVEAQLVVHQKNEVVYEEKIVVLEFEVKDKSNAVTRLKNHQLSSKDKAGLGYGDQLNKNDSSGSELFNSIFDSRSSDGDDNQTNDRFKKDNGYHNVPLPLTGNYMPPLANLSFAGLDDSVYRPTSNKTSASVSQVETNITPPSNASVEMPRVEFVRTSGVIIEDWVSDDEDIFQSNDLQETDKPSLKRIEFTNAKNESVKPKQAKNPNVDRRDWNEKMTQKLGSGFGFTKKACFVCGSYSHLIKDCDFHEKKMAKKSVLKNMGKNTGQGEIRPVWNSVQRINHQNKFVPSAVLTRSGRVPASAAKQSSLKATVSTSTFRPVNTATHTNRVNVSKLRTNAFHKWKSTTCIGRTKKIDRGCTRHMTGHKTSWEMKMIQADDAAGEKPVQKPASENEQGLKKKRFLDKIDWINRSEDKEQSYVTSVNTAGASRIFGDVGSSFVPLKADFNNMELQLLSSPIPTTKCNSIHPKDQIIRRIPMQEPTKIAQALNDESWVEAMQEELLQFKIQSQYSMETNKALAKDEDCEDVDVHYIQYDTIQASIDADALFAAKLQQEDRDQLKGKTYEEIQGLYEREQKFIHDFVPMDSKKEEKKSMEPESEGKKSKRLKRTAGSYEPQKSPKKPKVMKSIKNVQKKEAAEYCRRRKEELRADGSSSYHGDMQGFLRRLDKQDLNDLYRFMDAFVPDEKMELWMNQLD